MKRTLAKSLIVFGAILSSAQLSALGLGELELKSALNQPLSAEIELLNMQDLTSWEVKPSIASQDDFAKAGVEYSFFLDGVDFEVVEGQIKLSTNKAVSEPFLNFLIEVKWPSGRVLREYTLLLDPPVFEDEPASFASAPTTNSSYQPDQTQTKPAATPQAVTPINQAASDWDNQGAVEGEYKVQYSDTLWEIALATRPSRSVSPQQMMIALQQANPDAFINGNINRLKTHHVLRVPDEGQIGQNSGQAIAEVRRQNNELYSDSNTSVAQLDATENAANTAQSDDASAGGELRLVSEGSAQSNMAQSGGEIDSKGGQGTAALQSKLLSTQEVLDKSRLENKELRDKLDSLEDQIATMQKLVSLKNDPLAAAQAAAAMKAIEDEKSKLAQSEAEVAPEETATTDDTGTEEATAGTSTEQVDFNYVEEATDESIVDGAIVDGVAPEETTEGSETQVSEQEAQKQRDIEARLAALRAQRQQPEPSLIDTVLQDSMLLIQLLAGAFLLIALAIFAMMKRRKKSESTDDAMASVDGLSDAELAEFDNESFESGEFDTEGLDDFDLGDNLDGDLSGEIGDELSGDTDALSEIEDEFESEASSEAQTSDVIGECDIYIAYGRFDQAVELLKSAIASEPQRVDLRIKLLEVFVELDDSDAFATAQSELAELGDAEASQQADVLAGRLSSPVVSSLETATEELEFSTDAIPDLSLSDELPDLDIDGGDDALSEFDGGLDFAAALDLTEGMDSSVEPLSDSQDELSSLEQPEEDDFSLDFDLNDIDVPELTESSEPDADLGAAESIATDTDESSDALEFDLSGLDDDLSAVEDISIDEPVDVPQLEQDLEALADDSSNEADELLDFDVALDFEESDELSDLANLLDAEEAVEQDLDFNLDDLTSADSGDSLEADLAELSESISEEDDEFDAVDLDVPVITDSATSEEIPVMLESEVAVEEAEPEVAEPEVAIDSELTSEVDLDSLVATDDDFDFLAGTDECATKLDLARAYIDMEDIDGARELLDEVVGEGTDQQKQDARDLMDKLS